MLVQDGSPVKRNSRWLRLQDTDVAVFAYTINSDRDISVPEALRYLAEDELQRARRYHYVADAECYLRCRGYLRKMLGGYLNKKPESIRFSYGQNGKPYVRGGDVSFNVSHSGSSAVCAMSKSREVGIDLEVNNPERCSDAVIKLVFTPAERRLLRRVHPQLLPRLFFQLWTAKEAFMKLTGQGMSLDPRDIEVECKDGRLCGYIKPISHWVRLQAVAISGSAATCHIASVPRCKSL